MAVLVIRDGEGTRELELKKGDNITIGRAARNQLSFPKDLKISNDHCNIHYLPEKKAFGLHDLGSTNGTMLNLNRIAAEVVLSNNDKILVGDIRILFRDSLFDSPTKTKKVLRLSLKDTVKHERTDTCIIPNLSNIKQKPRIAIVDNYQVAAGIRIGESLVVDALGGFKHGTIYNVSQSKSGKPGAMKLFNRAFDVHHPGIDEFYNTMGRLSQLDNPYLLNINEYGVHEGHCYYVCDLVETGDLNMRIAESAPFSEIDALCIIFTVGSALHHLCESHSMIHGDLSPATIMLDLEKNLILRGHGMTEWILKYISMGDPIASPWFISPEQVNEDKIDWYSDMYSLGVVFFQLLTGYVPFQSDVISKLYQMHVHAPLPAPEVHNPNVWISRDTKEILTNMTAKKPSERFRSWGSMLGAVELAYQKQIEEFEANAGKPAPAPAKKSVTTDNRDYAVAKSFGSLFDQ